MNEYLSFSSRERREFCEAAEAALGLNAASIDKDFWICRVLRELFALPNIGSRLTFKGGTSLSKGWKLIERFSEDIDVVIDREFLGFGGDRSPENAATAKQRSKLLGELRGSCRAFVQETLSPMLHDRMKNELPPSLEWKLSIDADDPDEQTLLVEYPAAGSAEGYIRPVVKLEFGARSDIEPSATPAITPYLAEALPEAFAYSGFEVRTVAPERTFLEKSMLLHEERFRASSTRPKARLARHYYDLSCLVRAGVADKAVTAPGLFERVAAHRAVFFDGGRRRGTPCAAVLFACCLIRSIMPHGSRTTRRCATPCSSVMLRPSMKSLRS